MVNHESEIDALLSAIMQVNEFINGYSTSGKILHESTAPVQAIRKHLENISNSFDAGTITLPIGNLFLNLLGEMTNLYYAEQAAFGRASKYRGFVNDHDNSKGKGKAKTEDSTVSDMQEAEEFLSEYDARHSLGEGGNQLGVAFWLDQFVKAYLGLCVVAKDDPALMINLHYDHLEVDLRGFPSLSDDLRSRTDPPSKATEAGRKKRLSFKSFASLLSKLTPARASSGSTITSEGSEASGTTAK